MLGAVGDKLRWWLGAGTRRRERRDAAWREAAARKMGVYRESETTLWKWAPPTIEAPIGDALVHLDVHAVQVGNSRSVFTRTRADYVIGLGPKLKAYRDGWAGKLGTMLGFEDVALSDPAFDDAFVVRSADVEATRRAWTGRARSMMLEGVGSRGVVQTTQQRVTLLVPGVVDEPARLEAAMVVVGDLACYGSEWLEAIWAIPESRAIPPEGAWDDRSPPSAEVSIREHLVRMQPVVLGARLATRATSACARELSPFELEVEGGRLHEDPPEGLFGPLSVHLLGGLGAGTITSDGRVVRVTVDIESPTSVLHSAAQLAAHLARGEASAGTFR